MHWLWCRNSQKEQREALCALEDLKEQERTMYEIDNRMVAFLLRRKWEKCRDSLMMGYAY